MLWGRTKRSWLPYLPRLPAAVVVVALSWNSPSGQKARLHCTVISSNTGDTPNTKAMFCYPLLNITSLLLSWLYFGKLNYTLNHDFILFEFVRVCVLPLQLSVCKYNSLFLPKKIFYQIKTVIDLTVMHSPPHLNSSCVPKKTNLWI